MKHIASLILLATLLFVNKSYAQQTQTLTADKHNEYGLVYKLPITTIRFDVTARQTVSHAGPFYQYAKKYILLSLLQTHNSQEPTSDLSSKKYIF